MYKHYEFTGETKVEFGVTLRRIRAADTFVTGGGITIQKGDLGGWI